MKVRSELRNIAIIAHVDHGKTTLVDALFRQAGVFRSGQVVADRIMDSGDLERERGITIMAKCTAVRVGDVTLQLVDTPGHADFGGEVERTLRMVDGVLLLVDASEGPLPQTRFVLRKSLELGLPAVLAINKIDRGDARIAEVLDEVYELFINLGADESQIDFPVLYTNARAGTATTDLEQPGTELRPLVDALVATVPPPPDRRDEPFLMQANSLAYDDYVGRLVVGRVLAGQVKVNDQVQREGDKINVARITGVYRYDGVRRVDLQQAQSGDIVSLAGFSDIGIGDTLSSHEHPHERLPALKVDEPTVAMIFQVNNGPLVGRSGGKYVTSRHLRQRLEREAFANVSIRVEPCETADQIRVLGRGELQLSILIETMRREGYDFCVRNPQVVVREGADGRKEEPTERLVIDLPLVHMGVVNELLGPRKARLEGQHQDGDRVRLEYVVPTRGLLGLRGTLLTATRGTAVPHTVFEGWIPWSGPITQRATGAIVADHQGDTTTYALFHLQPRGELFVGAVQKVYEGMIVGEHNRDNDINVNACRPKKQTNVRAANKDERAVLSPPRKLSLEQCLDWIRDDEMVEVTPDQIRIRKAVLASNQRSVQNPMRAEAAELQ